MLSKFRFLAAATIGILSASCASKEFQELSKIGGSVLTRTGLATQSQVDTVGKVSESVAKGTRSLSEEEEYYLGRGVSATILSKYPPVNDSAANLYLTKVLRTLSGVSDRPETFGGYHVQILNSNEINAVSAPGGFVFISKGFLKLLPSEDALAAVLAHEVAHVVKGHGMSAISEAHLSQALVLLGKEAAASQGGAITQQLTSSFGESIGDITNTLLSSGYSRSQEYDADEYALELLGRAGYNSGALHAVLKQLEQTSSAGGWTSTHPEPEDRLDEIDEPKQSQPSAAEQTRTKRFRENTARL